MDNIHVLWMDGVRRYYFGSSSYRSAIKTASANAVEPSYIDALATSIPSTDNQGSETRRSPVEFL